MLSVLGSRYTQGYQGGRRRAYYNVAPSPSPHAPYRRPRRSICDTPIEDGGSYPSRTLILEGVRPRSSIGVSKSRGPWRPQAYCGAPRPPQLGHSLCRGGGIHCAAAGALIVPRWGSTLGGAGVVLSTHYCYNSSNLVRVFFLPHKF